MMKRFVQASSTIASAAVVIGGMSFVSRFMGFIRDRVLLGAFPDAATMDVYLQAFRIPDLTFQLLISGAIGAGFIPFFSRHWYAEDEEKAWRYANRVGATMLLFMGVGCVLVLVFRESLAVVLAPGFAPAQHALLTRLLPLLMVAQFLFAVSFLAGSMLQATKRFFLSSFAPVLYNAGIIVGVWLFSSVWGIYAAVFGVLLGATAHMTLQLFGAFALGYRPRFVGFWDADVRRTLWQSLPRVFALAISQIGFLGMMAVASQVPSAVRNLTLAYNLNTLPLGIIAISYAMAAFPTFAEAAAKNDRAQAEGALSLTLRQVLFFLIPATAFIVMLRAQLTRAAYGVSGFSWTDTLMTADALAYFALSFFAQGSVYVLVRLLHAYNRVMGPVFAGLCGLVVQTVVSFWLFPRLSILALPIGFSAGAAVQAAVLLLLVYRILRDFPFGRMLQSLATFSSAGFVGAFVAQGVKIAVGTFIPLDSFVDVLLQIVLAGGVGAVTYMLVCFVLRSPELFAFLAAFRAKFLKAVRPTEVADSTSSM